MKNPTIPHVSRQISGPLAAIASPQRIAILFLIGRGEACVCHLESALGWRQAYISQHLMALRKAEILQDRRVGRFVYYRLKNASYLDVIAEFATMIGLPAETISSIIDNQNFPACECPLCSPPEVSVENPEPAKNYSG